MLMLLVTFVICGGAWYYVWRKNKADEAARDAQFRATMLALEEKAKREGTYVGSYFDDWSKPKT
jgi:hypothetical protein